MNDNCFRCGEPNFAPALHRPGHRVVLHPWATVSDGMYPLAPDDPIDGALDGVAKSGLGYRLLCGSCYAWLLARLDPMFVARDHAAEFSRLHQSTLFLDTDVEVLGN
jgi:hypothetical protein